MQRKSKGHLTKDVYLLGCAVPAMEGRWRMDRCEVEGLANDWHVTAGGSEDSPASLAKIVRVNDIRVERSRNVPGPASTGLFRGQHIVNLRYLLPELDARFYLAHELMEISLRRVGYVGADIEQAANYGAAALLCPRRIFLRAAFAGLSYAELAQTFLVSQTLVVLRLSELLGSPRAVVCPHRVYVAGEGAFPEPERIRSLVRGPERAGITRARLTDARRRTVLEFAESA